MISLEGLIRELFFKANAWRHILVGALLSYFLLGFGYLRSLAQYSNTSAQIELPPFQFDKKFFRQTFSALPLGAFYLLVPLFFAYGVEHLLRLVLLDFLSCLAWGLAWIAGITLSSVALVVVPEDPERFFLGLEFEKVLVEWWKLKRVWIIPALACYGLVAGLGWVFYGLTFFLSAALLVPYLSLSVRNLKYL